MTFYLWAPIPHLLDLTFVASLSQGLLTASLSLFSCCFCTFSDSRRRLPPYVLLSLEPSLRFSLVITIPFSRTVVAIMHWRVVAATTLLVGGSIWQASASGMSRSAHPAAHDLHRRDASLNDQLGRSANRMMKRLDRRQQPDNGASEPAASTLPQSGQASQLDLQAWNDATSESCMAAVAAMSEASNPSGITVCYNVPFLDNSTGVFEAELRLYNVSPPFDDWAGVRLQDISVSLSYLGAEVQATENNFNRRSVVPSSLQKRQERSGPQPLKVLTYVGRINRDLIGPAMNA